MSKVGRLLLLGLCGVSGCGQDVFLDLREPAGTSTPTATRQPQPTVTPTAIPTPTPDFGDGHDGPLNVAATVTVNINECRGVVSASGSTVEVSDAAPFPGGRRILVHQAQADFASVGDSSAVTTATMGGAGLWEITTSASIDITGGDPGYLQNETDNDFGSTAGDPGVVVNQ